ncbi:ABC transporter substrate-binding protein [Sphingomicrobium astaxanthinifaciens]|uniref:ABC transporter substrate-binding protein n=1 Tax=Sphingomicrobium astaxanthinifaciens TaxID=1227949 RepID=UPI001FCAE834|nr:hypothetical protein [Sphingomicrobium astaxanthinifaciens]MCJ7420215.1 hypothetical protein [Sphingomicrobium astaxanthinifaciens]
MPFLASAALRVASLDLCADEYALLLAREGQLVSVSHLGRDAQENVLAARAADLPGNDGRIVDVARLEPELVLTSRPVGNGARRLAERLGIEIVTLPYAASPREVRRTVARLGRLFGTPTRARHWLDRFDRLARAPRRPAQRALFIGPGGTDPGTLASGWLALAGVDPMTIDTARGRVEAVVEARPELILESRYREGQWHRGGRWREHPLVRRIDAPRHRVDGRPFICGGPLMLDVVERLGQRARP